MPLSPITRRDWLLATAATTASLAFPTFTSADDKNNSRFLLPTIRDDIEDPPLPMFAGYLGSNRFRVNSFIQKLQFSSDGKRLFAMSRSELNVWDYESGQSIAHRETPDQNYEFEELLVLADTVNVLLFNRETATQVFKEFCLHICFDAWTLKPLKQIAIPFEADSKYAYHPNGKKLFVNGVMWESLYDLDDGHLIAESQIDKSRKELFCPIFSPDGKSVLLPTLLPANRLVKIIGEPLLGLKIYLINRKLAQSECWMPDGKVLVSDDDNNRLAKIDSNGNIVYVSTKYDMDGYLLSGVTFDQHYAIQLNGGKIRLEPIETRWLPRVERKPRINYASSFAQRAQDHVVAGSDKNCVDFFNPIRPHSSPQAADFPGGVHEIHWSSRNELTAIGFNFGTMTCRIDRPIQSMVVNRDVWWKNYDDVKFSDDGSTVVTSDPDWIQCCDASGQQKIAIRKPDVALRIHKITSDLRYALGVNNKNQIWKVDLHNGECQLLSIRNAREIPVDTTIVNIERVMGSQCVLVCKVGKVGKLFIVDLETMNVLWNHSCELERNNLPMAFCRDGQLTLICHEEMDELPETEFRLSKLSIMLTSTGKVLRQISVQNQRMDQKIVVSPDSRIVIVPQNDQLSIREIATLDERFAIPSFRSSGIAVSPDSRYLARDSFFNQYPVELFNLRGEFNPADPIPENYSLNQAWVDLQSISAKIGFRAIRYLAKHPEQAIRLFKSKIPQPKVVGDKLIQQWIEDLDDNDFKTREAAHQELQQVGKRFNKQLKAAFEKSSSAEVRHRLQLILQSFTQLSIPQIIIERACEVLQWIESSESKALLREWSRGAPQSPLTEEAIESLKVLKRLESDPPTALSTVHTHSPAMPAPSR